ncbi:MAG TPA: hemerythrin domain-containing protein [Polyangiaceae bacterium]|jgi:iron-sulfur cluster repair protein YtfE (RIC family)|nr:hemerythrin domain-containing protein [Polyangiaceae bacterium]
MARSSQTAATDLLKTQHRKVEAIFKKLEGGRSEPTPLLDELSRDLAGHMKIEQDIFYPTVRKIDEDLVLESFEEHALAEIALKRLLATSPDDPTFIPKVTTLKELIMHHVQEEEEELFPKVEKKLGKEKNLELGIQMKELFDETVGSDVSKLLKGSRTTADVAERRVLKQMAEAPN